jgi:hypothetical protein
MDSPARVPLVLLVLLASLSARPLHACTCGTDFALRLAGTTTVEIAVAWDEVPDATAYVVERSATCDFSASADYTLIG